ncbi:MAG: hypothetical protein ACI8W7_004461, partial [Gammaproteobacteria bacterium]
GSQILFLGPYLTAEQRRWRCAAAAESNWLFCDTPLAASWH